MDQAPLEREPPLDALRDRIRETAEAAQRLAGEARAAAGSPPPRGYEVPRREGGPRPQRPADSLRSADLADIALLAEQTGVLLVEVVRGLVPAELRGQFSDALRELLVALRALLDWYLERLSGEGEEPAPVEDIPIS
ncbi:hypothetical protein BH20ACT18_BH20ACT18_11940 [soil metagenome]